MRSEFEVAFNEIAELRNLPRDIVLEALSNALVSAYRRDAGIGNAQQIDAQIDPNTGRARVFVEKEVVETVEDSRTEVDLEKARFYNPEAQVGDVIMVMVEGSMKKYGRIAAQTAKQVILQKIREAERTQLYEEFSVREGDLVNGTVQSLNASLITVSLGRAEAILPRAQQIPSEKFKPHDKLRAYIMEVKKTSRGPQIVLSRAHRDMLRRLLEYEVPEIYNGHVEIKSIAREAGYRSKVAVAALQEGIDPVGACVGMRGGRIQNIVKELHDEKIDVIEWNANQEQFIAKALSPARVTGVYLEDDPDAGRTAVVIVPDDQLSLAIGKEGQNARLAAKLTGWRIDIKSVAEAVQEAIENRDVSPVKEIVKQQPDIITEAERILEKKALGRTIQPEEFTMLGKFADMVQRKHVANREASRRERRAQIEAVKATLPAGAFQLSLDALDLPAEMKEALKSFNTVGDIMVAALLDERRIKAKLNDFPESALRQVQDAIASIVIPEYVESEVAEVDIEPEAEPAAVVSTREPVAEAPAPAPVMIAAEEGLDEAPDAFPDLDEPAPVQPRRPKPQPQPVRTFTPAPMGAVETVVDKDEEEDIDLLETRKGTKAGKNKKGKKGRQVFYDEERGESYVKRQRKGNRGGDLDWDEEL
ncbi:MAG: transcription termination factor NusA [Chloroflexota bacterium]|nr:transcription termination factor NusA [Chloroflexota bacterium]